MNLRLGTLASRSHRSLSQTARLILLLPVALLSHCSGSTEPEHGWLSAAVREGAGSEASAGSYDGTGDFRTGRDPGAGVSVAFSVVSTGTGASSGRTVMLYRPGHSQPGVGRYELGPVAVVDGHLDGFTAFYDRTAGGHREDFTALSGYVIVRRSSADRFDGDFQFTGVMYCSGSETPGPSDWCTAPTTITPGAPQVELTGSFAAVPYSPGVVTLSKP